MMDSASRYVFAVRQEGRSERRLTVDGVVGGGHLLGGGTQGFVTRVLDGTVRFMPFDYSRQLDRWFCSTTGRRDAGLGSHHHRAGTRRLRRLAAVQGHWDGGQLRELPGLSR